MKIQKEWESVGEGRGGGGQNMAEIIPGPFGDVAIDVKTKVALQKR